MLKKIFTDILWKFKKKEVKSELVKQYDEAIFCIQTYEKAKDYNSVIMATRELILKHKSWINYYEEWLKKMYSLEASNIEEISKWAKEKIKKVREIIDILYKRLSYLEKKLLEIEKIKEKKEQAIKEKVDKEKLKHRINEINDEISNKEYVKALTLAKKFAYDFQHNKKAINILQKTQRLYDNEKSKKDREKIKQEKLNKALKEMWIDETKVNAKEKKYSFWNIMDLKLKELKRKRQQRWEYVKKMKTLESLEIMLAKIGSINNVWSIDINQDDVFSIINSWMTKEIEGFEMYWFDVLGKIIGKDKIIWDTFGHFKSQNNKTVFYFGDATGHWIQAWFTVSILSKIFYDSTKTYKQFQDFFVKINNELKEKIKWKSFITWIFFEWDWIKNELKIIWAGHLPLLLYKRKTWELEKIIAWWLAMWVRNIPNTASVKVRTLNLDDWDVIVGYTDWVLEAKDWSNKMYWQERLEKTFSKYAKSFLNPEKIYDSLMNDLKDFKWWVDFEDDVSFFIYTRNTKKDLITNKEELQDILKEVNSKKSLKDIQIKKRTKEEIIEELKKERQEREIKIRLERLDRLAKIWEYIKLKQEVLQYYKEWFVHEKMKKYLEKAIVNEQKVVLKKQEEKLKKKYTTLLELYKKWEYDIVAKEALDVIFKNGKV